MTGRSILWRTCALPVAIRAMPENEIPPATRVDYYLQFFSAGEEVERDVGYFRNGNDDLQRRQGFSVQIHRYRGFINAQFIRQLPIGYAAHRYGFP